MARTQAAKYGQRRMAIVESAAALFAEHGFLGTSIADLAKDCSMSKSLIYHYYPSKEGILFAVMDSHLRALLAVAENVSAKPASAREKVRALMAGFMELYVGAAARHKVLLNELNRLDRNGRNTIVREQRKLIEIVKRIVTELEPALSPHSPLRLPAAMLFFGMINWTHTWMNPEGRAKPSEIAELAANIFLGGLENAALPKARRRAGTA